MANKKKNSQKKQTPKARPKAQNLPLSQRFKAWWAQKHPAVIFILLFFLVIGVFYAFYSSEAFKNGLHPKITTMNARAGSALLNIFGYGTTVNGADISNNQFSVTIKRGCDALEPIALLLAIMIAFPVAFGRKLPCIFFGTATLLIVNVIRVVTLFIAGLYSFQLFDTMHVMVWQFLFILVTLICCAIWINWATKNKVQPLQS